jgi:uncharacterized protein (DUF2336 family)
MAAAPSLLPELEDALRNGSAARRAQTLERITTLFLHDAGRLNEDHVGVFDEVLGRLVEEIETKTRAELSRRLAPVANAPTGVMRQLAHDNDIAVAGPVLSRSPRLSEHDLLDIANNKGQAHLLAISGRRAITESVTDVLVRRGDREVARSLAENAGARLSESGFSTLIKRAEKDGVLAEKVGLRSDVPPHLYEQLIAQASEVVQKRLLASASKETRAEIRRAMAKVSEEMKTTPPSRGYIAAQRAVLALHQKGKLNQTSLRAFANAGKYEETVASLSAMCGVPIEVVDRLMSGDRSDPVMILSRAVGFEWPTVKALIQVSPGGRGLSAQALDLARVNFERLSDATAERVLRFWQLRQSGPE